MKRTLSQLTTAAALFRAFAITANTANRTVGESPWGPKDEFGRLNLSTIEFRSAILAQNSAGRAYDLSVEYFIRRGEQ